MKTFAVLLVLSSLAILGGCDLIDTHSPSVELIAEVRAKHAGHEVVLTLVNKSRKVVTWNGRCAGFKVENYDDGEWAGSFLVPTGNCGPRVTKLDSFESYSWTSNLRLEPGLYRFGVNVKLRSESWLATTPGVEITHP